MRRFLAALVVAGALAVLALTPHPPAPVYRVPDPLIAVPEEMP